MRRAVALALGVTVAAVLPSPALADPVRFLPDGDIEFDVQVTTFGSLGCHNTEYADYWHCRELPGGSVEIRNGDAMATISFVGQSQTVAVAANTPRPIALGEIVGEATPDFVFPALPSPQWAMLSLAVRIQHGGVDVREAGWVGWYFAPGGSAALPLLAGPFAAGVYLGTRPDGYDYQMLAYQFSIPSIQANGRTALGADVNAIPEPGTLVLLGSGLLALSRARRRK
jgi:hypothetical protein